MIEKIYLNIAKFTRRASRGENAFINLVSFAGCSLVAFCYYILKEHTSWLPYTSEAFIVLPIITTIILFFVIKRLACWFLAHQPGEDIVQLRVEGRSFGDVHVLDNAKFSSDSINLKRVSKADVEAFSTLNYNLFKKTRFAYDQERILERNSGIFKKDPLTSYFLQVNLPLGFKKNIGISHVLPMNESGAASYFVHKGLSDGRLNETHIASRSEPSSNFVFFSLGMDFSTLRAVGRQPAMIGGIFVFHLKAILIDKFRNNALPPEINVWAQITNPKGMLGETLITSGMNKTTIISGDGASFYKVIISNLTSERAIENEAHRIFCLLEDTHS